MFEDLIHKYYFKFGVSTMIHASYTVIEFFAGFQFFFQYLILRYQYHQVIIQQFKNTEQLLADMSTEGTHSLADTHGNYIFTYIFIYIIIHIYYIIYRDR